MIQLSKILPFLAAIVLFAGTMNTGFSQTKSKKYIEVNKRYVQRVIAEIDSIKANEEQFLNALDEYYIKLKSFNDEDYLVLERMKIIDIHSEIDSVIEKHNRRVQIDIDKRRKENERAQKEALEAIFEQLDKLEKDDSDNGKEKPD